jgi:hypothetical protein
MLALKSNGLRVSLYLVSALSFSGILFAADEAPVTPPPFQTEEIAVLRAALLAQQKQLEVLRQTLVKQQELLEKVLATSTQPQRPGSLGTVASLAPMIPVAPLPALAIPAAQAKPANTVTDSARIDALQKGMDALNKNLGGIRLSGDFRFRLDEQLRTGNNVAGPLQNSRFRYRLRLNVDKDFVPGLSVHAQLSTAPYTNETTNDQDAAGFGIKAPFSLAEAWVKYAKGGFSIRGGRMEEVFADSQRFMWDDDVRFTGFDARYTHTLSKAASLEFRVGEYILSNPNTPIVPAGSPYLNIGYSVGQKVRDATLFHPGAILKAKTGRWTNQIYSDFALYRNADQIQLASTAAGFPVLESNAIGISLSGAVGQTGNAVTTAGGAIYTAREWQLIKGGFRADYADMKWGGRSMPFWFDFQALGNAGTDSDNKAFMASVNFGQIRKYGDMRFLYQYSWKQANSMISQFTDDDLGTGSGVNTRVNSVRFDLGITRFLQWQNILFIQDPIAANKPGFFVPLQKGANTTYRYLGHLAFTF